MDGMAQAAANSGWWLNAVVSIHVSSRDAVASTSSQVMAPTANSARPMPGSPSYSAHSAI